MVLARRKLVDRDRHLGEVETLEAILNGAPRRVVMQFAKVDDQTRGTLIRAFEKRERIMVTGDLVREGKRFRLESPHDDLHIEADTDLD